MALAVIFADYDPGTLTAFYIIILAGVLALFLLVIAGLLYCFKARPVAAGFLLVAGLCVPIGYCIAQIVVHFAHKGTLTAP